MIKDLILMVCQYCLSKLRFKTIHVNLKGVMWFVMPASVVLLGFVSYNHGVSIEAMKAEIEYNRSHTTNTNKGLETSHILQRIMLFCKKNIYVFKASIVGHNTVEIVSAYAYHKELGYYDIRSTQTLPNSHSDVNQLFYQRTHKLSDNTYKELILDAGHDIKFITLEAIKSRHIDLYNDLPADIQATMLAYYYGVGFDALNRPAWVIFIGIPHNNTNDKGRCESTSGDGSGEIKKQLTKAIQDIERVYNSTNHNFLFKPQ